MKYFITLSLWISVEINIEYWKNKKKRQQRVREDSGSIDQLIWASALDQFFFLSLALFNIRFERFSSAERVIV